MKNRRTQNRLSRGIKKSLLSAFLIVSFSGYALENRVTAGGTVPAQAETTTAPGSSPRVAIASSPATPAPGATLPSPTAPNATGPNVTAPGAAAPTAAPNVAGPEAPAPAAAAPSPTVPSAAASSTSSGYKDGTYTGPVVNVDWGLVQVQATIQRGKINNVQFLQYPKDRRTSARINSIANPELQQEAIQAQSANVDIISGATLTSEGFQMSLQAALNQAGG